jgi:hypothetical protein
MSYPVIPTEYQKDLYQPEMVRTRFFSTVPTAIQEFSRSSL